MWGWGGLRVVSRAGDLAARAGPVGVDPLARGIEELIGVRAEVVALCLEQVGRKPGGAVAVVEGEGGGKSRDWDTEERRGRDHLAP